MDGTLDFNFQQGVLGTAAVQVSDGGVIPSGVTSQSGSVTAVTSNATSAGVYASTNAATPAAPPSWVH